MASPAREARLRAQTAWPGAIVTDRNRTAIYHHHPTLSGAMIDAVIGAMHTLSGEEIDTAWRPSAAPWQYEVTLADYLTRAKTQFNAADVVEWSRGGANIAFIAGQLDWHNNRNDVQLISTPQAVTGTVDDERITWQGAWGARLDFEWRNKTTRLLKLLRIGSLAALATPSQQILTGGNPVLRLQFQFSISNNIDIYVNGTRWSKTGQVQSNAAVEFRHADTGETLWYFQPGAAWDTSTDEGHKSEHINPVVRFRKTGPSLFVEVRVPWSYLQNAVYPVYVDPTIDVSVAASADDGDETSAGTVQITPAQFNVDGTGEWAAYRFTGITITNYASMVASHLTLYFASSTTDEPEVTIYGENVASPAQYAAGTATFSISNRTKTTATSLFSNANLNAPGSFNTSSLNSIIAELVAARSYSNGVMAFQYTSTNGTGTRDCEADMYDSANADPALHIEYNQTGTQTPQSVAGELTSSGALANQARKPLSGSLTTSGTLINSARKILSGALTSSGSLAIQARKILSGELTSSGIVAAMKISLISLGGTLTMTGGLATRAQKSLSGILTSGGAIVTQTRKNLAGILTSAGALANKTSKIFSGELTSAGSLSKRANISVNGTLTSSGTLINQVRKALAGALTFIGDLATQYISGGGTLYHQAVEGTLTMAGTVTKMVAKNVAGILSWIGELATAHTKAEIPTNAQPGVIFGARRPRSHESKSESYRR